MIMFYFLLKMILSKTYIIEDQKNNPKKQVLKLTISNVVKLLRLLTMIH